MKLAWEPWLYGLVSGFIGGGAGAVGAGVAGMYTDPAHFNPANGVGHLFTLMFATFLVSGAITSFAYLSKSPLPPPDTTVSVETTTGPSTKPQTTKTIVTTGDAPKG